ncbi:hypothetical protein Dimus_005410, partial [Dionaea muscipula]
MCVVDDGHRSLLSLGVVAGTVTADFGLQLQQGRGGGSGALPLPPLSDVVDTNLATIGAWPAVASEWATGFREGHNNVTMKDGQM